MNQTKQKILKFFVENKKQNLATHEIAVALNLSLATVQKYLRDFKQAGRIANFMPGRYKLMNPKIYFDNFLFVYKKNQLVAYLNFDDGQYSFAYDSIYLCQANAQPVSPKMALTEEVIHSEKMFIVFEQLMPEGRDRKILEKQAGSANDFDLLPFLQHVYGDLQFSKTTLNFEHKSDYHVINYAGVKDDILGKNIFPNILDMEICIDDNTLFPEAFELEKMVFTPSGLSGFQHKLSIVLDGKIIRLPNEDETAYYFMKPYSPQKANPHNDYYFPHLAINEHLFMTFAKNVLGFDVPSNGIVKRPEDCEYHYVVKRFDRYKGYKFSHDEFATLMGLDSESKYQTTSERMFKRIKKYLTLPNECLILLKYYFYSMLIVHEDMHTKNLSVRTEGKTIAMSPLYDIATTAIYQNTLGYETHLPINGKRTNIRLKDFYVLVDLMNVERKIFDQAASFILFNYTHKLPEYFEKLEDAKIYKKSRANLSGKKPRFIQAFSLAESLVRYHHARIKQLEKNGWYAQLGVPTGNE
jgi:serine/threonine-protein kinase HipA